MCGKLQESERKRPAKSCKAGRRGQWKQIKNSGHAGRTNKKSRGNGKQQSSHKSTSFCQDAKRLSHVNTSQQETYLRNNSRQGESNCRGRNSNQRTLNEFSSSVPQATNPSHENKRQQVKQQERNSSKPTPNKYPQSPPHPPKSTHINEAKLGHNKRKICLLIKSQVKPGPLQAIPSHHNVSCLEAASISNSTAYGGARPKTTPFSKKPNLKNKFKQQQDQNDITTDSAGEHNLLSEPKLFVTSSLGSASEPKINFETLQQQGEKFYQQTSRHDPLWSKAGSNEVIESGSNLDEGKVDSVAIQQSINQDNLILPATYEFLSNNRFCKPVKKHVSRATSCENHYDTLQQQDEKSYQQPTMHSLFGTETGSNKVIQSSSNLNEQEVDSVAIQEPTNQADFILPTTNEFLSNSNAYKPAIKHVHWHPSCDTASSKVNKHQNEEYIAVLESVNINKFHNSVLEKTIVFMYDHRNDFNQNLIHLAVKILKLKLGQYPKSVELVEFIDASNFNEKQIVNAFIDFCKTPRGEAIVKPLVESMVVNKKKSPQGNATESSERLIKGKSKENTSQGLEIQEDIKAAESSSSVEKFEEQTPSLDRQCFTSETTDQTEGRPSPQLRLLKRENKFLKDSMKCIKCSLRSIEITTLPCTHFALCSACVNSCSNCPLCNQVILAEVKTFLA